MKTGSKPRGKPPPTPSKPQSKSKVKDPVGVYCRLRPLRFPTDLIGAVSIENRIVQLTSQPSELGDQNQNGVVKETQFVFKYVFDENHSQKAVFDHVAKPLVEDLLQGINGLLFTYGVTGSGKTFTMTGNMQDGGILPRCLDVIFNSVGGLQARKYTFKPDKMNGFDVQSVADAMLDRQQKEIVHFLSANPKTPKRKPTIEIEDRVPDLSRIDGLDEYTNYAVFVQYIEIYNNYVYDLLEDSQMEGNKPKPPQSRLLREDAAHNMYVHCCTEVEVKSPDEVFEVFYKGQKRRRVAHTTLNSESSRSHCVFTIRLVQGALDALKQEILEEKSAVIISQLSLVDLAGSERMGRTKTCGDRKTESTKINASLMTLRTCIETLRENQVKGTNKLVPYRDSKLTHLFKNYFDGEGKVRMIVCISPSLSDCVENHHVMKFAELTQEVQVDRPTPAKVDRRRPNKKNIEKIMETRNVARPTADTTSSFSTSLPHRLSAFNFGLAFPSVDINSPFEENTIPDILEYIVKRKELKQSKAKELHENQMAFRKILNDSFRELEILKIQNQTLTEQLKQGNNKLEEYETKLLNVEKSKDLLVGQLKKSNREKYNLRQELDSKVAEINAGQLEKLKLKVKMEDKLMTQREKMNREVNKKIEEKEAECKANMWAREDKLRRLREVLDSNWYMHLDPPVETETSSKVDEDELAVRRRMRSTSASPERGIPVANPRHRRSLSASEREKWVDHTPKGTVDLGTMLQPNIKRKKSVTELKEKHILAKDSAYYVLTHQEQAKSGEIETSYFKGSVIPSSAGGAQVIFNDIETLKQTSPGRKRNLEFTYKQNTVSGRNIEERCSQAIEGHNFKKRSKP